MDSGAFSEVSKHGGYLFSVEEYAGQINRWKNNGKMLAAVSQDYMCEPFILKKTGLSVLEHQVMTVTRYDQLVKLTDAYIMPVLQGYKPEEYVYHIKMYGCRLYQGQWVGVGSVCKRNSDPKAILAVLKAIHEVRPDLKLHGFGVKTTSLAHPEIRAHLHTADSMAWSYSARMAKRDGKGHGANSPLEAHKFTNKIVKYILNDF